MSTLDNIRVKFRAIRPVLNERATRLWAASEAQSLGRGGVTIVARATGISRPTIYAGLREIGVSAVKANGDGDLDVEPDRSRTSGGGRKRLTEGDATLLRDLEAALDSTTRGHPESPLRWTCRSVRELSAHLRQNGHAASYRTVARLLSETGYSLQANRKTQEGSEHADRDAQFEYINRRVKAFQAQQKPVISVDTKKKELVGNYKNGGREWRPKRTPRGVKVHDFGKKKAIPYGVFDLSRNNGWVSVGMDHDTPAFAVATIGQWWLTMGRLAYPRAAELLITADGGGSNSSRARLWKIELQKLATATGLSITVCHLPPGTSKWNKIEHRMFCHISRNWRARPLESYAIVVQLIGSTTTRKGLHIHAKLDKHKYPTGVKVSDGEMADLNITRAKFHGEWNYTLKPIEAPISRGADEPD